MKSLRHFARFPAGKALLADDILEFHAGRLLLLLNVCGTSGRIDGLTKFAKLDFFVRYPQFLARVLNLESKETTVESSMTRFHYGPWDRRYYHVLSLLEGKRLISVRPEGKAIVLTLTPEGKRIADHLRAAPPFADVVEQMRVVKKHLGHKSGSALKRLIYERFDKEITRRPIGQEIP